MVLVRRSCFWRLPHVLKHADVIDCFTHSPSACGADTIHAHIAQSTNVIVSSEEPESITRLNNLHVLSRSL